MSKRLLPLILLFSQFVFAAQLQFVQPDCQANLEAPIDGVQYLSLSAVEKIHAQDIKEFGGLDGLRARTSLEAAVQSPKATFGGLDLYPTVFDKAAALAYGIAESQPFVDGNKRAALDSALTFLTLNGFRFQPNEMKLYDAMMSVAKKTMGRSGLAALFRNLAQPVRGYSSVDQPKAFAVAPESLVLLISAEIRKSQIKVFEALF